MDKARPLLRLAKTRLDTEWLHRWWCKKYNLPRSDHRYGDHTEEELLLEFFEDIWESDPQRALVMLGTVDNDIVLETGDPELDDIERRLAAGEDPDEVLQGWGDGEGDPPRTAARTETPVDQEFEDDYRSSDERVSNGLSWSRKD